MSLVGLILPNGISGFGYASTAEQVTDGISLKGKTYLVTGCNSGLGLETMRVLCLRGAQVVGSARSVEKAETAMDLLRKQPEFSLEKKESFGTMIPVACELSDPKSVKACVQTLTSQAFQFDGIIANAGIMALPKLELCNGVEQQFNTNHIGHFILINGLLENLTATGRVVMVSSGAHSFAPKGAIDFDNLDGSKGYNDWVFYGQSKIANLLFAKELATKLKPGQTANAVHPGVIVTNLFRHMNFVIQAFFWIFSRLVFKSIPQGAATQVFVATHPSVAGVTGDYFADCNTYKHRHDAKDPAIAKRLWEVSEEIVSKL